ncbi:MAG: hypothetical protein ABI691_20425 [Ginsengibacter sp.]
MNKLATLSTFFLVIFFGCTKITPDTSIILAEYTLGTGGDCTGAVVAGRYVADTAVSAENTVTITVDVSVPGPYWITTNTANGISFSQVSTFSATGPQTAVLTATGTPLDTGMTNFTLRALNGLADSCTFSVQIIKGIPPHYYLTCFLNGVYRNFSDSAGAANGNIPGPSGSAGFYVSGRDTVTSTGEKIEFGVASTMNIGSGIYTDTSSTYAYFSYADSLAQTWLVNNGTDPTFTVVVTSANAINVQGTFSGVIKKSQGTVTDTIAVTNGIFSVPVK